MDDQMTQIQYMSIGVCALMLVMFMIFCNSIKCGSSACSDVGDIGGFRGVASNDYDYDHYDEPTTVKQGQVGNRVRVSF